MFAKLTAPLIVGISVGVLAAVYAFAAEHECKRGEVHARLEIIKNLAGTWVQADESGRPTEQVVTVFRVTAAGTAVEETLFPGTDHEMITMYHMDGDDLVLTHYCAMGNQPRMKAERSGDPRRLVFKCTGGTNMKSEKDAHMHEAVLTFTGEDHYTAEWISSVDGKPAEPHRFSLVRRKS